LGKSRKFHPQDRNEGKKEGGKMGLWEGIKEQVKKDMEKQAERNEAKKQEKREAKQYQKDRIKQLKRDHIPYCPRCKSTDITFVQKRFSLGRTIVGGAVGSLFGPIAGGAGAVLGGLSSKKGKVKCLKCGKEWKL
jgi:DNA-directed RNA polymerase subunit M/transcription elongation factor TFIIS